MPKLAVEPNVLSALIGIGALLVVATAAIFALRRALPAATYAELVQRIQSWWVMVAVFTAAITVSDTLSLVFFAFVSFMALKEYFSMIPTRRVDRRVLFWAYLTIPFQYLLVGIQWYGLFLVLVPVFAFLFLPMRMVLAGETRHFLRSAATVQWGLMAMVFGISHLAYLLALPDDANPGAGGAGLVLFVVALTQLGDVAQYLFGTLFGRKKILPSVSPNKTLEGFVGGAATTILLAGLAGPWLTPLAFYEALAAGALIGVGGFVGDVTISALKRDLGVKDTGSLLPGHGGVLDRIDSLIFIAPLFFHFLYYLHY